MAPLIAAVPAILAVGKTVATGFSIFQGVKGLFSSKSSQASAQGTPQQAIPTPQIADATVSRKKRRRIGRNALIQTDQEDILGNPTTTSRSFLTSG